MSAASRARRTILVAHPGSELYGSDRVLLESVSGLVDDGWDVVVAVPGDGPLVTELRRRGARVELCASPVLRKSVLRPRGFVRFAATTVRGIRSGSALLRRERPAAVYVNTVTIPLWIGLARLARVPVVAHVHEGEATASRLVKRVLSAPLLLAESVIANSRFSVGVLESAFPALGRRTHIVYNAVPGPETRSPARPELDGDLRVTYIGRLSPRKGVDVAIDAIAELDARGIPARLDLVGAVFPGYEWYERDLRDKVEAKRLQSRVSFRGFQPSVWDFLSTGDVVLVPSVADEPFGNTAVEGILSGRPVIASATSGLLEATDGYRTTVTVEPGDATSLADALERTIAGWEASAPLLDDDAETARRKHSPESYRRRIAELVRAVALR
ncbi:glycosyltransferase [Leifsonia sp. 1010]|uniref:glycosyltransferase n=1 Tax=Leifsonia sp. 1010 TaxID=2817769 RepID=UPI00285E0FD6|nr:glycosyltransferase [Leifsonia sp. 1010]MDR6610799.1 glycosyltransferase involved in cell wall biosynthesis [Leifsonia sp. 1010]